VKPCISLSLSLRSDGLGLAVPLAETARQSLAPIPDVNIAAFFERNPATLKTIVIGPKYPAFYRMIDCQRQHGRQHRKARYLAKLGTYGREQRRNSQKTCGYQRLGKDFIQHAHWRTGEL
jgi:hypothetical protein